mmetsp:Transcript_106896/g.189988  ORF Transcript_106896/g.189988 Transcript_106896/m.189988 type:complete len:137 (+) Transcript_106896:87-497(+)
MFSKTVLLALPFIVAAVRLVENHGLNDTSEMNDESMGRTRCTQAEAEKCSQNDKWLECTTQSGRAGFKDCINFCKMKKLGPGVGLNYRDETHRADCVFQGCDSSCLPWSDNELKELHRLRKEGHDLQTAGWLAREF